MPLPPPAPLAPSCTPPQAPYAAWQQLGLSGAWCSWVLQARIRALGNPRELLLAPQPHPQEEGAWRYPITPPSIPLVPRLSWQSIPCRLQMSTGPVRFSGRRRRGLFVLGHPSCHHCLRWGARHEQSRRARTQLSTRRRVPEGKAKVRGL